MERIVAREFGLVDLDGRTRARLATKSNGDPEFVFMGPSFAPRAGIQLVSGGAAVTIQHGDDSMRCVLGVREGRAALFVYEMFGTQPVARVEAGVVQDGGEWTTIRSPAGDVSFERAAGQR